MLSIPEYDRKGPYIKQENCSAIWNDRKPRETRGMEEFRPNPKFTPPKSGNPKRFKNHTIKVSDYRKVQPAAQNKHEKGHMDNLTEVARQLAATLKSPYIDMIRCPVCGAELRSSHNVGMHMKRHTGNYSIRCEICQQGFERRSLLARHMKKHGRDPMKQEP